MLIQRLRSSHEPALEECLQSDPIQNLFLLGLLGDSRIEHCHWYGAVSPTDEVLGVALVIPTRLLVPWCPDLDLASAIGRHLRDLYTPSMLVGPREASDAIWASWASEYVVDRWYDQRLYSCEQVHPSPKPCPGFRRATMVEWPIVARHAAAMELEDLGHDPSKTEPAMHERVVRQRIDDGKTWVIERDGQLVFQINVGTTTRWGAQIGGTYVPPAHRGQGLATDGTRAITERLLQNFPAVTLHVNEANRPAVQCYARVGYQRAAPFRLLTLP